LLTTFRDAGWLVRRPGHRALRLTAAGASVLSQHLGLKLPDDIPVGA
jgi:hypothetical protein